MRMRYSAVPWVRYKADKDICRFIKEHGKLRTYKKGECIIPGGYMYPYLSYVASGMLSKSFDVHNSTKDFAMSVILPGSTVGDFYFMSRRICSLKIAALRETTLIECPHEVIEKAMLADVGFFRKVMNHLMLDMESDSEGLATITARPTEERLKVLVKILLVRYAVVPEDGWYKLPVYFTHNEIGRIIYTTPLTVNRLLLKFKQDGVYLSKNGRDRYFRAELFNGLGDWFPEDPLIRLKT